MSETDHQGGELRNAAQLAERWGVSEQHARNVLREMREAGNVQLAQLGARYGIHLAELERWEAAEEEAGRKLPGARKPGPAPGVRPPRED